MIIERKDYRQLEWYLYRYEDIKKRLNIVKFNIIDEGTNFEIGTIGGGSFYSDPTGSKAIKLCSDNLVEIEKLINAIEKVINKYKGTLRGALLEKKYFKNQRMTDIMQELHIEKTTCYMWKDEIIIYTALMFAQDGLMKI